MKPAQLVYTPWGAADDEEVIADGIAFYSTPSHGGYLLSDTKHAELLRKIPGFRTFAGGPWYEEDCDAAVVPLVFPQFFPAGEAEKAAKYVRSMPDQWERYLCVKRYLDREGNK